MKSEEIMINNKRIRVMGSNQDKRSKFISLLEGAALTGVEEKDRLIIQRMLDQISEKTPFAHVKSLVDVTPAILRFM